MIFSRTNLDQLRRSTQVGPDKKAVAWKYFGSADSTTGGLGTGVFGPNIPANDVDVPLVMTKELLKLVFTLLQVVNSLLC